MNIADALRQLKAFARQDGVVLWLVWLVSFAMMRYAPQMALGNLLALSTPLVVMWRLKVFRTDALEGVISYRRAWVYSMYVFFYASILFAVTQYAYFRFLDNGVFVGSMVSTMDAFAPNYMQMGMTQQELGQTKELLLALTPIELSFLFMMQNLFLGGLMSLFIAAFGMKRRV
ncbi:MAG: DUF4199 domain-containing protein [Prevotella sp.]|nr:DUF4199 domain-containing protein [Prevotellaceae bacterium]MDY3365708.1 DUF4199 domain-containing protein [Prevotella sp.]MDY3852372.1 DUF4199 domain-containing protein [Prevotella sp.]